MNMEREPGWFVPIKIWELLNDNNQSVVWRVI
jgi:hypothetical protein